MAIQQVLKAQKISFLLRGGVRVLVSMRDTDTGEGPGVGSPLQGRVGVHPAPQVTPLAGWPGADSPSWLGGRL